MGRDALITVEYAIDFLEEAARYFSKRPTLGEDRAYWANVFNSENCLKIVELIKQLDKDA